MSQDPFINSPMGRPPGGVPPPERVEEDDDEKPQQQSNFRQSSESEKERDQQDEDSPAQANKRLMKKQAIETGQKITRRRALSEDKETKDQNKFLRQRERKKNRQELKDELLDEDQERPGPDDHSTGHHAV